MTQPPEMQRWLSWTILARGSKRLTINEYRDVLRELPRSNVLVACARLSALFKFGREAQTVASKELTERWIPQLFPPFLVPRVQDYAARGWVIFFQGQIRFLAAEALRSTTTTSEDTQYQIPDVKLGTMLLGSAELLYKPHIQLTEDLDVMANLIADFLPIYEIDSLTDPFMLFMRFYILLFIIIPRMPERLRTFNVEVEFQKVFGFPLKIYSACVYSLIWHAFLDRDEKAEDTPLRGPLTKEWFKNTDLSDEQIENIFAAVSCSISDLPDKRKVHGYADFEFLRDHPYFRHEDQLYCLDYEYAVAKLESGALWRVLRALPKERREPYLSFWGDVFEEYLAWLFDQYPSGERNVFYRAPKYQDSSALPICDAVVVCDGTAVLIEAKLATCPANVRYSGDYVAFKNFLEERLVVGTNRKVGVSQLLRGIENIATLQQEYLPKCLQGVRKFIPLIITKDDIGSSWMTNAYLNARFRKELPKKTRKRFVITPLMSMSIATLERAMSALSTTALSDILEDRIQAEPKLSWPFEAVSSYVPRGTARNMGAHMKIMHEITEEMIADLGMKDDSIPDSRRKHHRFPGNDKQG